MIEYEPNEDKFIIKDSANKDMTYRPTVADIVTDIDKKLNSLDPILQKVETQPIYRHNPSESTGMILRITAIQE